MTNEERKQQQQHDAMKRALQVLGHLSSGYSMLWYLTRTLGLDPKDEARLKTALQQVVQALQHVSEVHNGWLRKTRNQAGR